MKYLRRTFSLVLAAWRAYNLYHLIRDSIDDL